MGRNITVERVITLLLFVSAFMAVLIWKYNDGRVHYEDHVYIKQLMESVAETGKPSADAQDAINDMLFSGFLTTPPEQLCTEPLSDKSHMESPFAYHPYFILYLLAPVAKFMDVELLLTLVTVAGFFLLLYLMLANMRSHGVGLLVAGSVLLMAAFHPVWSQGLQGQMYAERFFIPLAALLIWLVNREQRRFWLISLVTVICALVTERTGLIIGLYLMMYALLYTQETGWDRKMLALLGGVSFCYSVVLIMFFLDNASYSGGGFLPHSLSDLLNRFADEAFVSKLEVFLFFNLIVLGVFAIWDWRAFSIALVMMIPNIIGNIGGAEKTGFLTHYHSLYMPFLFWAVSAGVIKLCQMEWRGISGRSTVALALMIMMPAVGFSEVKEAKRIEVHAKNLGSQVIPKAVKLVPQCFEGGSIYQWRKGIEEIQRLVPEGVKVTTSFWGMPILEHNRTLYYYPLGLDVADYALVKFEKKNGQYYYTGALSYLGAEAQDKLNQCMNRRLVEAGYDVSNPKIFAGDMVLLHRPDTEH